MNIECIKVILEELDANDKKGCGVLSLALKTGLPQSDIRAFLTTHNDCAIPIGGQSKYKINRYGPHKGSVKEMLKTIEKQKNWQNRLVKTGYDFDPFGF